MVITIKCRVCDGNIELSDRIWHCISCQRGMCGACLAVKVGNAERFLCQKCSKDFDENHYLNEKVINVIGKPLELTDMSDNDCSRKMVWCIVETRSRNILHISVDDGTVDTLAYSRNLGQISRLADKLYDAGVSIARAYLPDNIMDIYPPFMMKTGGSVRRVMIWRPIDIRTGEYVGKKATKRFGPDWLGSIVYSQ